MIKQTWRTGSLLHNERFKLSFFPNEIENMFFEILLSNTKTTLAEIMVRIIYRSPSRPDFLEIINTHFTKLNTNNNEIYMLGDFNINLYVNNSIIFQKNSFLQSQSISGDIENTMNSAQFWSLKN